MFDSEVNTEERILVQKAFEEISLNSIMKCTFVQTKTVKSINKSFTSSGTLLFSSDFGMAWQFEKPFVSTTLISDQQMIQIDSKGRRQEVVAEGNDLFARFSIMIQSIFNGDIDLIDQEYEIYYQDSGKEIWAIGLIPKDSILREVVDAFELSGSNYIESFKIYEGSGDSIDYEFREQEFPTQLTAEDNLVFQ